MKVFISWSGERSRKLAEFLSGWLRKLPLTIVPWVSKEAIDPGTRWGKELAEALEGTSFGILCITSENQKEPWVNFEAGALSKTIEKTYVVPYLIGMKPAELDQPLKQFQACEADEEGTWRLIETIFIASGDKTRTIADLKEAFNMWWQKLNEQVNNIIDEIPEKDKIKEEPRILDIKNDIDKILTVVESLSYRLSLLEKNITHRTALNQSIIENVISRISEDYEFKNIIFSPSAKRFMVDMEIESLVRNLLEEHLLKQSEKGRKKKIDKEPTKIKEGFDL